MFYAFIVFAAIATTSVLNADGATHRVHRKQRQISTDKNISDDADITCGQISRKLLIGNGGRAQYGSAPWNVGVYRKNNNNNYDLICGGTLIATNLVVSAAHCFWAEGSTEKLLSNNNRYKIAVGKYNRDISIKDNAFTQIVDAHLIYIEEYYFGPRRHFANDIAVIVLIKKVNTSSVVLPVCMDWNKKYNITNGSIGKVVGWGKTENSELSPILLEASLPYIDGKTCRNRYKNGFDVYVTRDKFCAGSQSGQGVLEGDSGAGLTFVQNKANYLIGIVSVKDPETNDSMAVFSDVSYSIQWIHNIYKNYSKPQIQELRGYIVQWEEDTSTKKINWLVGSDGYRRRVNDESTLNCLMNDAKKRGPEVVSTENLEKYPDLKSIWAVCGQESMEVGRQLEIGTYLKSKNGARLTLTQNGLLAVDANRRVRWTPSEKGDRLIFRSDNNLVLYDKNKTVWASNTEHSGAITLSVQNDGNFGLYDKNKLKLWSSESNSIFYHGKIVYWDNDNSQQKKSWLVGVDGNRRWIPNLATYQCLKGIGLADSISISSEVLDKLPDLKNIWAVCGQDTMELGRQLEIGTYLKSKDGARLTLTHNGLVAVDTNGNTRWTPSGKGNKLILQDDYNLVLYDGDHAIWASNTLNSGAISLSIQNDGTFALFSKDNRQIWTSESNPNYYRGKLVQWDKDNNQQKKTWLVGVDGNRRWVPNIETYECLKNIGKSDPILISSQILDQFPELDNDRVVCGQDSMEIERQLELGTYLKSKNGARLTLTQNGLVAIDENGNIRWTPDGKGIQLYLQRDNNLVLYNANYALWASNTVNSGATTLTIHNNGIFALYDKDKRKLWSSESNLNFYHGKIVHSENDKNQQKNSWLVGADGKRRWISNKETYECLKGTGLADSISLSSEVLDKLPDLIGVWVVCGQDSLEMGRQLDVGTYIKSKNGAQLTLTQNGLVAVDPKGNARWTPTGKGIYLILQYDNNLVLYDSKYALWASNTVNSGATSLLIQNDGTFALFSKDKRKIWASENDPNNYRGKIVHWENDKNRQKKSWLVGIDGNRRLIPNVETYQCLKEIGLADSISINTEILDQLPDLSNIWAVCGQESMEAKKQLEVDTYLKSKDGARLILTKNGLQTVDINGKIIWKPSTKGSHLILQDDNNLVLYDRNNVVWSSNTANSGAVSLSILNDGNFALYDKDKRKLWSSESNPSFYRGKIVHSDNDKNQQKNSWLVGVDGNRRWISNMETYECLKDTGLADSISVNSEVLDKLPDLVGIWVVCGQDSMDMGRQLELGTYLKSKEGARLTLTQNGLVAIDSVGNTRWTPSGKGNTFTLQRDNNLVLYDGNHAVWASNTVNSGATSLSILSNGTIALYDKDKRMLWSTDSNIAFYRGKIVHSDGDKGQKKNSWLVDQDGNRRWVSNMETYQCLKGIGLADSISLSSEVLDKLPDLIGVWVVCGQDSMEIGRQLELGTYLKSKEGARLTLTQNGLVAIDSVGNTRWTPYGKGNIFTLQRDNNLVLYDGSYTVWTSVTANTGATYLSIHNDGNFALYDKDKRKLWSSESNPGFYHGKIVHWDNDKNQKNLWLVGTDGKRRWISDMETYRCLKGTGLADSIPINSEILDKFPDLIHIWVVCGQESMEIGRQLEIGTYLKSKDGARLTLTHNGLVAVDANGNDRWTPPGKGNRLILQDNHNLVLYDGNRAVWNSNTENSSAISLSIQNDGTIALFDKDKKRLWTYDIL